MKKYLGDGVYVELVDEIVILTTENGTEVTNQIILEPDILYHFIQWVQSFNREQK
jgi:hypothetical protein